LSRLYQPVVVLVDDDEDVLATTAHMLQARGFRVLTATDRDGAMALCREQEGRVDALVADLSLPGEVTGELVRSISAAYPAVKVVYATGIPRHIALGSGLVRPDAPYIEKPVDPDVLAGMLRSLLPQYAAQRDPW
jgi:DNA-binding NtrC family response regulator